MMSLFVFRSSLDWIPECLIPFNRRLCRSLISATAPFNSTTADLALPVDQRRLHSRSFWHKKTGIDLLAPIWQAAAQSATGHRPSLHQRYRSACTKRLIPCCAQLVACTGSPGISRLPCPECCREYRPYQLRPYQSEATVNDSLVVESFRVSAICTE